MRCRRHRSWSSRALSGSRCGEVRRSAQGTAASPTSGPVAPEAWRDWQHHPCDGGHRDRPLQRHRLPGPCPGGLPGPDRSRRRTRPASRLTRRADVRRARRTCGGDGREARPARHRGGRPGRVRVAQQRPAARRLLRRLRLRPRAGAGELPALGRGARYIVKHSGARVLYVDPELEEHLASVDCEHKFVLGNDDDLFSEGVEPQPWEHDENATATINYTSGTTARPKGVQITHRNIWTNAITFALHAGVTDRDVFLHTLPMFHANGWGMPFAMTGMGVQHIVLRKVDGAEILPAPGCRGGRRGRSNRRRGHPTAARRGPAARDAARDAELGLRRRAARARASPRPRGSRPRICPTWSISAIPRPVV
jgi:hypothetical protein